MIVFDSLDDPKVVSLLQDGAVGIIPTDTIYGIVALANSKSAVERLYELKHRRDDVRGGTVIAANAQQLVDLGVDVESIAHVAHYWPNPLSIELSLGKELAYLFQTGPHRAFRVVADNRLQEFLQKTEPLLTSSVNPSGMPPATDLKQAQEYFGDAADFYVNGGDLSGRPPSTVAVLQGDKLIVVRPGAVTINNEGDIVQ